MNNKLVPNGPGCTILTSTPKGANQEVLNAYGEHKDVPHAMLKNFEEFYSTDAAPNPQIVANDISELVTSERGSRKNRVVSGIDYGVVNYNENVAPIQEALVKDALQMEHLLTVSQN